MHSVADNGFVVLNDPQADKTGLVIDSDNSPVQWLNLSSGPILVSKPMLFIGNIFSAVNDYYMKLVSEIEEQLYIRESNNSSNFNFSKETFNALGGDKGKVTYLKSFVMNKALKDFQRIETLNMGMPGQDGVHAMQRLLKELLELKTISEIAQKIIEHGFLKTDGSKRQIVLSKAICASIFYINNHSETVRVSSTIEDNSNTIKMAKLILLQLAKPQLTNWNEPLYIHNSLDAFKKTVFNAIKSNYANFTIASFDDYQQKISTSIKALSFFELKNATTSDAGLIRMRTFLQKMKEATTFQEVAQLIWESKGDNTRRVLFSAVLRSLHNEKEPIYSNFLITDPNSEESHLAARVVMRLSGKLPNIEEAVLQCSRLSAEDVYLTDDEKQDFCIG